MEGIFCFNCEKKLEGTSQHMQNLLECNLPVFCSQHCANVFPDNYTNGFHQRMNFLKAKYQSIK